MKLIILIRKKNIKFKKININYRYYRMTKSLYEIEKDKRETKICRSCSQKEK